MPPTKSIQGLQTPLGGTLLKAYLSNIPDVYTDTMIRGLLEDARDSGVNTVIIRDEGARDAENQLDGPTRYLTQRSDMVRELGLNVILGGFRDILDDPEHNEKVKWVIEDYINGMSTPQNWGRVIGIHGFDEPDGKYDAPGEGEDPPDVLLALSMLHVWSNDEIDLGGMYFVVLTNRGRIVETKRILMY